MDTLINLFWFALILTVIVFVHELGHFLTAKAFGVYCEEFSIGMGPAIFKKKKGETTYAIRILPIGGYVSMAGEEGVDTDDLPFERTLKGNKVWQQCVVMLAGIFMNIVLAWTIFVGTTMFQGKVVMPSEPIVASMQENSPAAVAGFLEGDRITKLIFQDGKTYEPKDFNGVLEQIQYHPEGLTFSVDRGGSIVEIFVTPKLNVEENIYQIGVGIPPSGVKDIQWYESFGYGTDRMISMTQSIYTSLLNLVRGVGLDQLSGPVGIFEVTRKSTQNGFISILLLVGLLSLNIGIFNLLPIPALDGGRVLITLLEKISGKKINKKVEQFIMTLSFVMIFGIMIFATWKDIVRMFFS